MFINSQEQKKKDYYEKMLKTMGSLSKLFSESDTPYLYYRVAENLFCKSFGAENLSRKDTSFDAALDGVGFGLKTFLKGGKGIKMEKVAEFNAASLSLKNLVPEDQVREIARLRNERITAAMKIYGLREMMYHCVVRSKNSMSVIEVPMRLIDVDSIEIKKVDGKSLSFSDRFDEYTFNFSKSTLFKQFVFEGVLMDFPVEIIEDPFQILEDVLNPSVEDISHLISEKDENESDHVFLPLYSTRSDRDDKEVPEKSGLNQWNAAGRPRSLEEVYIPIPAWIHQKFPDFFPPRDHQFNLHLPDKKMLVAKVCQEGSKALMTNPNVALGQWILRDVLDLKEGELLTYEKLEELGLDAVVIHKDGPEDYRIDFSEIGSYDSFEDENDL
jgi:hypothetical protein